MPSTQITVQFSSTASVSKVWMDGVRLGFQGGSATKSLVNGRRHVLHWILRGAPASTYSIKISAPPALATDLADDIALGADRLAFGAHEIQL